MWPLPSPPYDVDTALTACLSNLTNEDLRDRYEAVRPHLVAAEESFRDSAMENTLFEFEKTGQIEQVSRAQLKALYRDKFAKGGQPGRYIYDTIRMSVPYEKCPLCGRGIVYSVDHHLPQTQYSALVITPINLVPACQDCNKNKTAATPTMSSEETLHPYFDDIDGELWLKARIVEVSPPAALFYVEPPPAWSTILANRVRHHFRVFKLRSTYAVLAAEEISNVRAYLQAVPDVRQHLIAVAASYRLNRRNSWNAAAYTAMSESDWFCNGGFRLG